MTDPTDAATPGPTADAVAAQFSRWIYPHPAIGVQHRVVWNDPGEHHWLYWPDRAPWGHRTLLVAGCGTSEAVALALRDPQSRVIGVDVSPEALQASTELAAQYGAANLELHHLPVERVGELGVTFDFVTVAGVLHHLADPAAGLRTLGDVLTPHGVIVGAVYGHAARRGIELVQAAFRDLDLQQTPEDVALARSALAALPATHPAKPWLDSTGEIWQFDNHVVDTWLPAREACYAPEGVLDLVEAAGLAFQGWFNNKHYEPDGLLPADHPLFPRLSALPARQRWTTMARLTAPQDHTFIACRADRPADTWGLPLEGDALLDLVPVRRHPPHPRFPSMPYDPRHAVQSAFYRLIDDQTPVRGILAALPVQADPAWLARFAHDFVRHLWRKDAVYLRLG